MSSSTEPKSPINEAEDSDSVYNVEEEENERDNDQFSKIKPRLLKTPSILNAIIDQIHPDIIAKFVEFPSRKPKHIY